MLIAQLGLKKKKQSIQFVHLVNASVKIQNLNYRGYFKCMTIVIANEGYVSICKVTERERGGWWLWKILMLRGIFTPVKCYHNSQFICLNVFTCICPIRPCGWQFEGTFHMHIQTKTDSKTLGGLQNVNTGFLRTKGRKENRKGK